LKSGFKEGKGAWDLKTRRVEIRMSRNWERVDGKNRKEGKRQTSWTKRKMQMKTEKNVNYRFQIEDWGKADQGKMEWRVWIQWTIGTAWTVWTQKYRRSRG
jgi:hypothetical protein